MARRRHLHPEEEELWQTVARTARPLHAKSTIFLRKIEASEASAPPKPAPEEAPRLAPFHLGEKAARPARSHDLMPSPGQALQAAPLQMDAKTHGRMVRGKLAPEARIDLHGMTLAEAHGELIRFVLNAHAAGLRLVLVITGKGKPAPEAGPVPTRIGVLRHQAPHWLRLPPLGPVVQQVSESHLRHGGAGAYYVYLRRNR